MWQANRALTTAGRFARRAASRTTSAANEEHATIAAAVQRRWGGTPQTTTGLPAWAQAVADKLAETDPRVTAARDDAEQAHQQLHELTQRHRAARAALRDPSDASYQPSWAVQAHITEWRTYANHARRYLAMIEAVPLTDAADLIAEAASRRALNNPASRPAATGRQTPTSHPDRWAAPSAQPDYQAARDFRPRL